MFMKGKVEIYAIASDGSERLVESGRNLTVDGAGELIVDMLTTPSSTLGIAPRVMDTSNWRFGALSFGPPGGAFDEGGYFYTEDTTYSSVINAIGSQKTLRLLSNSARSINGDTSTYVPNYHRPSYPDVLDRRLEKADTAYSILSGDGTVSYGHLENRIAFASGDASSYFQGGYPTSAVAVDAINAPQAAIVSSLIGDFTDPNVNATVLCASSYYPDSASLYQYLSGVYSDFNYQKTMDYRGFATVDYTQKGTLTFGQTSVSSFAGATTAEAFVEDPRVVVECFIGRWDIYALNCYGGFHQMGLWGMDCKEALKSNAAPFLESDGSYIDSNGVTKQEFKLFAKKTFTPNLALTSDQNYLTLDIPGLLNHGPLKVRWILDFRSDHD